MKSTLPHSPPLPPELDPLPPLLTWKQVVRIIEFWNLGKLAYARDCRDIGDIESVNQWTRGRRARYNPKDVLRLYPVGEEG